MYSKKTNMHTALFSFFIHKNLLHLYTCLHVFSAQHNTMKVLFRFSTYMHLHPFLIAYALAVNKQDYSKKHKNYLRLSFLDFVPHKTPYLHFLPFGHNCIVISF